jgi:hypothetical protein
MRTYQTDPHRQVPTVTWRQWLLPLGAPPQPHMNSSSMYRTPSA